MPLTATWMDLEIIILNGVSQKEKDKHQITQTSLGFSMAPLVKNPLANAGGARDTDLIPGLGRSPGEGNGNLFQYSCPWALVGRNDTDILSEPREFSSHPESWWLWIAKATLNKHHAIRTQQLFHGGNTVTPISLGTSLLWPWPQTGCVMDSRSISILNVYSFAGSPDDPS